MDERFATDLDVSDEEGGKDDKARSKVDFRMQHNRKVHSALTDPNLGDTTLDQSPNSPSTDHPRRDVHQPKCGHGFQPAATELPGTT